jgi:hypothetical protein
MTDLLSPRLADLEQVGLYLGGVSVDTVRRLIDAGEISVVRLPVTRHRKTGHGVPGVNRRVLVDLREVDALIERSREKVVA